MHENTPLLITIFMPYQLHAILARLNTFTALKSAPYEICIMPFRWLSIFHSTARFQAVNKGHAIQLTHTIIFDEDDLLSLDLLLIYYIHYRCLKRARHLHAMPPVTASFMRIALRMISMRLRYELPPLYGTSRIIHHDSLFLKLTAAASK